MCHTIGMTSSLKLVRLWGVLIGMVIGCEVAGIIGSVFTMPSIPTWYASLVKPMLNPPAWVFGPVWTTLYAMMGVSLWLVWRSARAHGKRAAYVIFAVQLLLNTLWSIIFFGLHMPDVAFAVIVMLWAAIVATMVAAGRVSRMAAWLLVPYLLWVSFAGYLNFSLWQLNKNAPHTASLPSGYTLDSYVIAETLATRCDTDAQCTTPGTYLIRSDCPYTTICLQHTCAVVCPMFEGTDI